MHTQTTQRPLEWWQVIECATVRELSRMRASGAISAEKVAHPDERAEQLERELAHHRRHTAKNPAS